MFKQDTGRRSAWISLVCGVLALFLSGESLFALDLEEVAHRVGITTPSGQVKPYTSLGVIRAFQDAFLTGALTRKDLGTFGTYMAFGQLMHGYQDPLPSHRNPPPVQEQEAWRLQGPHPYVRDQAPTPFELRESLTALCVAELMTRSLSFEDNTPLTVKSVRYTAAHKNPLSHRLEGFYGWDEAKGLETHIWATAFFSRICELLVQSGDQAIAIDDTSVRHIIEVAYHSLQDIHPFKEPVDKGMMDAGLAHRHCERTYALLSAKDCALAEIYATAKDRVATVKGDTQPYRAVSGPSSVSSVPSSEGTGPATLHPAIEQRDATTYVLKTQDPTLMYVMEKLTLTNIATWQEVYKAQVGEYWANFQAQKDPRWTDRLGIKDLNNQAGTTAVEETYRVFEERQKNRQASDFWVAYALSLDHGQDCPKDLPLTQRHKRTSRTVTNIAPKFSPETARHMETLVTVMTSSDTPFISFVGISKNTAHILSKTPQHKDTVKPLFAFIANVMRHRDAHKRYMINCPTPVIGNMLTRNYPGHVWVNYAEQDLEKKHVSPDDPKRPVPNTPDSPVRFLEEDKGLELVLDKKTRTLYTMTAEDLKRSWLRQHIHATHLTSFNPLYTVDLAFLASRVNA